MSRKSIVVIVLLSLWTGSGTGAAFALPPADDTLLDDFGVPLDPDQATPSNPATKKPVAVVPAKPAKPAKKEAAKPAKEKKAVVVLKRDPIPLPPPVKPVKKKPVVVKTAEPKKGIKIVAPLPSMIVLRPVITPAPKKITIVEKKKKPVPVEVVTTILPPPVPRIISEKGNAPQAQIPPPPRLISTPSVSDKGDKGGLPQAQIPAKPGSGSSRAVTEVVITEDSGKGDKGGRPQAQIPPAPRQAALPAKKQESAAAPLPVVRETEKREEVILPPPLGTAPPKEVEIFSDGRADLPVAEHTPVTDPVDGAFDSSGRSAENDDEGDPEDFNGGKKDGRPVAKIPPAPPRVVKPLEGMMPIADPALGDDFIHGIAVNDSDKDKEEPVVEHLPADIGTYMEMERIPKFIRINAHGYNVRTTPDFRAGRKDNVDFQNVAGSFYAVTRQIPKEEGMATGIFVDGEERWVFMPWDRQRDFQYCESEACFADIKIGLEAIAEGAQVNLNSLANCGIVGVDHRGRPVVNGFVGNDEEPGILPAVRPMAEAAILDAQVNRAPRVKPLPPPPREDCVADTRKRTKPDFRAFRSIGQMKRAFIEYMTPYALEVQEATGLPASVIIGQAALESGWGKSGLFVDTKNIFGHSCWRPGSTQTLSLNVLGQNKRVTGRCDVPRPTGGYYLTFKDSQESVYAYASNLLSRGHDYYPQVNSAVAKAKPNPANWREVVNGLKNYDGPNPNYRSQVRDLILANDLQQMETKKLCR